MLLPEQINFYGRWKAKAEGIPSDTIDGCIDKYVTLFITYNSLYDIVPEKVALHKGGKVEDLGDAKSATDSIREFLGAANILSALSVQKNDKDIDDLLATLQLKIFHIVFKKGQHRADIDQRLEIDLLSKDPNIKVQALLETLYYIRCNIVHGRKGLEPYQVMLVEPAMNILATINNLLFTELNNFPV